MFFKNLFKGKENNSESNNILEMDCLYMVWFVAGGQTAPLLDKNNNAWAVTDQALFKEVVAKNADSWMILSGDVSVKPIKKEEMQIFIDTVYYRYGVENIVLGDKSSTVALKDLLSIPATHYDRSVPNHEVSNPKVRRLILRFNQTIASKHGVPESEQNKIVNEYLNELRGSEVLIPYKESKENGKLEMYVGGMLGAKKVRYAYTDFEAIPEGLRNAGYINGMVQPMESIIDEARKEGAAVALNLNSNGGGLYIAGGDMDIIKNGGTIEAIKTEGSDALFAEALKYHNGNGVKVDMKKAVEYYTKAAEMGNVYAMNNLGVILFRGYDDIAPNVAEAVKWLVPASDKVADAAFMLARNYDLGNTMEQSLEKAAVYYKKAMDLGHADATFNLGVMYFNGEGVAKDQAKAIELMQKAAGLGSQNAIQALNQIMKH